MTVLGSLLGGITSGLHLSEVCVGTNLVLALMRDRSGAHLAGVAGAPYRILPVGQFSIGRHPMSGNMQFVSKMLESSREVDAAVGLAALNAYLQPEPRGFTNDDAADWLAAKCVGRSIAIFGRFPFIDAEIRPYARQVWVFEQTPQADELDMTSIETVLPQADIVAITSSTIVNHTIDNILPHVKAGSTVALLGPSTPLTDSLFDEGIEALFGVCVVNIQEAIESILAGDSFQKMRGLQRVSLLKPQA